MDQELMLDQMQPIVYQQLQRSFEHERLAHAYLFEGEKGTGKHEMGIWLAQHLFCTNQNDYLPCGVCNNCQRILAQEHPDVLSIKPEGQTIKVDQMRRLQVEFSRSGYESRRKVFLIQEAEKMNRSAANSLLKFLEEPSGDFLTILETDSIGRILPTIQSRCQILHFQALPREVLIHKLQQAQIPLEKAKLLAFLTNSFVKAVEISQNEWFNDAKDSIRQWFVYLQKNDTQAFIYVQKKLIRIYKEKSQQVTGLSILLFYYQEALQKSLVAENSSKVYRINQTIERILLAEQKLRSNVSFQAVAEQFVLQTIYGQNSM
ncbi:DNA polymerase III subunit delta' [Enterococcus ratti]|uniref:DNA polymerase III subunit delta n=1 Tax=Enterococcus ratti TaxID=150033 RepID=A0A1L8WQ79_9ENTE|nr:DNA polymerase III subunit delta' [Enterococcus ratti]OJG83156.1 DNA polymerase III subunit delta [Enterococcus ratti]